MAIKKRHEKYDPEATNCGLCGREWPCPGYYETVASSVSHYITYHGLSSLNEQRCDCFTCIAYCTYCSEDIFHGYFLVEEFNEAVREVCEKRAREHRLERGWLHWPIYIGYRLKEFDFDTD